MSDEIKISNKQISDLKAKSSKLGRLIGEIVRNGYDKDLASIKKFLLTKRNRSEIDARIITTVLQARQENEKIILKDNTFSKPLSYYLSYGPVSTTCLTNDQLYLLMLSKRLQAALKITPKLENFLSKSFVRNVTFISNNFSADIPTYKGFIQDYDPLFSAICPETERTIDMVNDFVDNNRGRDTFVFFGNTYKCFGDKRIYVIYPENMNDDNIKNKILEMKYLYNDKSVFGLGEKTIDADNKLKYLYKTVSPEGFCPSFWYNTNGVECYILIEYEMDYNNLFEYLTTDSPNVIDYPKNMCYWDTFQQAMDFLSVFALTNLTMSEDNKNKILEWIDDYNNIKSYFNKWRDNQLKMERVFHDFLNGFLNNSELSRFANLLQKAISCIETYKALVADKENFQDFMKFISFLPFCQMINNQMKADVYTTLVSLAKVLRNYVKGISPESIVNDVRGVAKSIFEFLPGRDIEKAAFPFICPGGSIAGDLIKFNEIKSDPLRRNVDRASKRVYALRSKDQQKKKDALDTLMGIKDTVKDFLVRYMEEKAKKEKLKLFTSRIQRDTLADIFSLYINAFASDEEKKDLLNTVLTDKRRKNYPLLNAFMQDFTVWRDPKKKKKQVSERFLKAVNAFLGGINKEDVEVIDDMEVEDEK